MKTKGRLYVNPNGGEGDGKLVLTRAWLFKDAFSQKLFENER